MRPTILSRLAAQLAARRSGRRPDWVWVAFVLAVALLIAVGVFMSVAVAGQEVRAHGPSWATLQSRPVEVLDRHRQYPYQDWSWSGSEMVSALIDLPPRSRSSTLPLFWRE